MGLGFGGSLKRRICVLCFFGLFRFFFISPQNVTAGLLCKNLLVLDHVEEIRLFSIYQDVSGQARLNMFYTSPH